MEPYATAKRDYSRLGWALLVMAAVAVGAQYLLSFLFDFLAEIFRGLSDASWPLWIMTFFPIYLAAMPAAFALLRRIPAEEVAPVKMPLKRFAVLMFISFPILYGGNIIGTLLSLILSGGTAENALLDYVYDSPLFTAIIAVLVAPFLEEFIFRRQIIDRLGRYGEIPAILVSALSFALFHMNLFQFFYAFGLGILLAYVYTRTRMLRYPVALHMIINFMGSVLGPWILMNPDMDTLTALSTGQGDTVSMLAAMPSLVLYMGYCGLLMLLNVAGFILLIIHWKKRIILPAPAELPRGNRAKTIFCNGGMVLYILFCLGFTTWALL